MISFGGLRFIICFEDATGPVCSPRHPYTHRKVDVRLPGKGNSNSHGARPVHLIITMIKCFRTSRLPMHNSLSLHTRGRVPSAPGKGACAAEPTCAQALCKQFKSIKQFKWTKLTFQAVSVDKGDFSRCTARKVDLRLFPRCQPHHGAKCGS